MSETISPALRFEILKRDGFTCQYCGLSAPDAVLEVDHVVPVSKGGGSEPSNLIAACYDCNRGKKGRPLSTTLANEEIARIYDPKGKFSEGQRMTRGGPRKGAGAKPKPPGEKVQRITFSLAPDLVLAIRAGAERLGLSQARLITEAVRAYLADR